VWLSTVDGRTLHFHLAGINNQNFIMRDDETGTWWQQVTGQALLGPLAGKQLEEIPWDEVTFTIWRQEHPGTLVLAPADGLEDHYASAGWEKKVALYPTVTPPDPGDPVQPRDLVVGVKVGTVARAWPWETLVAQSPILDFVGDMPLLIMLHPDVRSLRCFDCRVDGRPLELFLKPGTNPPLLLDAETGSEWDFSGTAISGPLAGHTLSRVTCLKDFWFDWKAHNPDTQLFTAGNAPPAK
jgi:uncharacterized protein DUF3179